MGLSIIKKLVGGNCKGVEDCKGRKLLCVGDWLAMEMSASNGVVQNLIVMRHGERMDDADPTWVAKAARPWDPPLTEKGHLQAQEKGKKLRSEGLLVTRIFVSPFLRCVQTTAGVIKGMYPDGTANSNLKVGHTPQFLLSSHSSFLIFLMMRGKSRQQECRQWFSGEVNLILFTFHYVGMLTSERKD